MRKIISWFLTVLLSLLIGCSTAIKKSVNKSMDIDKAIYGSIYLQRGSFFRQPEFEHFTLEGNLVFYECGLAANDKLILSAQGVSRLNEDQMSHVYESAIQVVRDVGGRGIDRPGNGIEPSDHGIFDLKLEVGGKRLSLSTSVDGVSRGATRSQKIILKFMRVLKRAVGGECGNRAFFGI